MNRKPPLGIKIIAFLYYIYAAVAVIGGLAALFFGTGLLGVSLQGGFIGGISGFFGGLMIAMLILNLVLAGLVFLVGWKLWKGRNWAKILTIIFALLGILSGVTGLTQTGDLLKPIIILLFSVAIGGYLIFSQEAKSYFLRPTEK